MNHLLSWVYRLGILTLLCTSCTDEDWGNADLEEQAAGDYYFVLKNSLPQTRVSYPNYLHSFFEEGDAVGIFALTGEGTAENPYALAEGTKGNEMYVVKNIVGTNARTPSKQVLEPAKTTIPLPEGSVYTYVVYYPYTAGLTYEQLTCLRKNVKDDQNNTGYLMHYFEQSDLLWDVAKPEGVGGVQQVNIVMEHAFSTIVVEVSSDLVDDIPAEPFSKAEAVVTLLDMDTTAVDINLTAETKDNLNYQVKAEDTKPEIAFWDFGVGTSGNRAFVAVVPSGQSIPANTAFLRIRQKGTNVFKTYQIKQEIFLNPGQAYVFSIMKTQVTLPDVNDDDTWVYDVIHPETGALVGVLCREYLRYQPGITDIKDEKRTGETYSDGSTPETKYINSQAWVFYETQSPTQNIPNLNEGTVVQFIYDLEIENNHLLWPAPHLKKMMGGIFAPKHGYRWADAQESTGWDYGHESEKKENIQEYHMHGGTITWNGSLNSIRQFTLPTQPITNVEAANGHIVMDASGKASVSYASSGNEGTKAILIPHYLIDRRTTKSGQAIVNRYPLVKIGYNQFWMTKSLQATILADGTPLTCYNHVSDANVSFASGAILQAGYIYPFTSNIEGKTYDPYHKSEQMIPAGGSYRPAPMYNRMAIESDLILPESKERNTLFLAPGREDVQKMVNYVGYAFAAKMNTDIRTYTDNSFSENALDALCLGKIIHPNANLYTVNICGLNLKPQGLYDGQYSGNAVSGVGGDCTMLLKSDIADRPLVTYFTIAPYDPFNMGDEKVYLKEIYGPNSYMTQYSYGVFAPIRFIMKFRNQADTGGSVSVTTTRSHADITTGGADCLPLPVEECKP